MVENRQNRRDHEVVLATADELRTTHRHWEKEFVTTVGTIHFAKKKNLPSLFDLFQGKLHLFVVYFRACKLGLGELERYINNAWFLFETAYNLWLYPEVGGLSDKLASNPRIERLERKYQRLCDYEDNVARVKVSLWNGEPLDSDDFVVVQAVEDCTLEMTLRMREAKILEMCISRMLRYIQRSLVAVKTYHALMDDKLKEMTEEEIRNTPAANLNIFVGDYLSVLSVRNRDGVVKLEDGQIKIPERLADSSSEEEE